MRGFWLVLAVGLALLVAAALRDRQTRLPAPSPRLDALRQQGTRFPVRLADAAFATCEGPAAEIAHAEVLCCTDELVELRELLPSLAAARERNRPLVVVGPGYDAVLLAQLASSAGPGQLVALLADEAGCADIAAACDARPAGRAELQAGAGPLAHGEVARLLADVDGCWVEGGSPGPVEA